MKITKKTQKATGFWYAHFEDPVYNMDCYLVLGPKNDADTISFCIAAGIDVNDFELERGGSAGCCWGPKDGSAVVMTLASFDAKNPVDINTFVHELFHFVHTAMSRRGQKHRSKFGDETYAYFIGFVAEQFWRALTT